jgi:hypothetical protein
MSIPHAPFRPSTATGKLVQFFFQSLPDYFKANDTYVEAEGGILERYLKIFQTEAEQYVTDLENMVTLQHPATTQDNFLTYVAEFFGSPPDTFEDMGYYSDLMDNIIRINRNRGSIESIRNFFKVMGTDCAITTTLASYFIHDDANAHDNSLVHHDGGCYPCVSIEINVLDTTNIITQLNVGTLTQNTRRIIQSILVYFLPINTSLSAFKYNGVTKDITLTNGNIMGGTLYTHPTEF